MEEELRNINFRVPRITWDAWIQRKEERGDWRTIQDWLRGVIDAWYVGKLPARPGWPDRIEEVDRQLLDTFVRFTVAPANDVERSVINTLRALAKLS